MELRYKFTLILFSSGDHGCHCPCDMAVYMCKVLCILEILGECASLVFWCWKALCWISGACSTTLSFLCIPAAACKLGSLSSNVFERQTSTRSELFSLLIYLDATIFVWLNVFTLIETICPKVCSKSQLKCAKCPLPVVVRR